MSPFKKVHIRVSLKAGTPKGFTRRTGAKAEAFMLPFKAIQSLLRHRVNFHVASMSGDPRFMDKGKRQSLRKRLKEIEPRLVKHLEQEMVDPYRMTLLRLKYANYPGISPLSSGGEKRKGGIKEDAETRDVSLRVTLSRHHRVLSGLYGLIGK